MPASCAAAQPPDYGAKGFFRDVGIDYPVADLHVGLQEIVRLAALAGDKFHIIEFSGHRLLVGLGPVIGAENLTDLCLGVRIK
jgi:hypothetical protein